MIVVDSKHLAATLKSVRWPKNAALPVLTNVLIICDGSELRMVSSDLELETSGTAKGDVGVESYCLPGDKLSAISRLASGNLQLTQRENRCTITAASGRWVLPTLPASDFPTLAAHDGPSDTFNLDGSALCGLIDAVLYASAKDDVRYFFNGIYLDPTGDGLALVETDGHRIAYGTLPVETGLTRGIIIPRESAKFILSSLQDGPVRLSIADGQINVTGTGCDITAKLIDGRYPDWRRVIPGDPIYQCRVARSDLKAAIDGASVIGDGQIKSCLLSYHDSCLNLSSTSTSQSEFSTEIGVVSASGRANPSAYNLGYLGESVAACDSEDLSLAIADDGKVTLSGDGTPTHVIMPMRI